jgi:hypothetical protein
MESTEATEDAAEILLDAECRLGEILAATSTKGHLRGGDRSSREGTPQPCLPEGIEKKQSHEAQQLHRHPDVIQKRPLEGPGAARWSRTAGRPDQAGTA